jgi:hypothetical protein
MAGHERKLGRVSPGAPVNIDVIHANGVVAQLRLARTRGWQFDVFELKNLRSAGPMRANDLNHRFSPRSAVKKRT